LSTCLKSQNNIKLKIQGGSPFNSAEINKDDIHNNRSGVSYLAKIFTNTKEASFLKVTFRTAEALEQDTRDHLECLPSTCFIQKKMLHLMSGYRNYAAEQLLPMQSQGNMKKPPNNIMMSCFNKIIDCLDILEVVAQVWQEDYFAPMGAATKRSIVEMMRLAEDFATRIYPVIFSDSFGYSANRRTETMAGDKQKYQERRDLIFCALRFNSTKAKQKQERPLE